MATYESGSQYGPSREELQSIADSKVNLILNNRGELEWLSPSHPDYDDTWGTGDYVDPYDEENAWLRELYSIEGWTLPTLEEPPPPPPPPPPPTPPPPPPPTTPGEDYVQPEYLYYGDSPDQDWQPDLSYLRDAPAFDFEAEEYVPGEAFRAYERPDPFSYAAFTPPSSEELLADDPGYQFRLAEGLRALEGSAAQRGTLRSGATLQALMDYGQDAASQEYEKAYRRRLQDYQTNRANLADAYAMNLGAGERGYGLSRETDAMNEARRRDAYMDNYRNRYQVAQDRYRPQLATWQAEQAARGGASAGRFNRQWDAYRYAQPSATTVYTYVPRG